MTENNKILDRTKINYKQFLWPVLFSLAVGVTIGSD